MAVYLLLEQNIGALVPSSARAESRDDADRLLRILDNLLDPHAARGRRIRASTGGPCPWRTCQQRAAEARALTAARQASPWWSSRSSPPPR